MSGGRGLRVRWAGAIPACYSAVAAALIAGPLLGPGYLLLRDAVSTPRSYPTDSALGLGDAAPRAVPQDAVLAALSSIIDGGLLVKAILLLALWAAGYGAAVLSRELLRAPTAAQLVATTVTLWNPYVAERLLQGHWSLLAGYAALPWTVVAAHHLRTSRHPATPLSTEQRLGDFAPGHDAATAQSDTAPTQLTTEQIGTGSNDTTRHHHANRPATSRSASPPHDSTPPSTSNLGRATARFPAWGALAGCLAAAGLTPTGALLAACVALVTVGRRNLAGTAVLAIAASAPWLAATAVSGAGSEPSDPTGIAAFAARAEPWLGTLGSLAGLGGIWNGDAVPASRTTPVALVGTALLLALVALGVRTIMATDPAADSERRAAEHIRRALLVLAVVAVALPALAATSAGIPVMEWLVVHVPGAGLLRDTQKYVALAVPAYALCAAAGCQLIARLSHRTNEDASPSATTTLAATLCTAALVLPLLDLAWGVSGALRPVHYLIGWQRVAEHIDGPGDIAVLPGGMFRKFPYSGKTAVLDPAPRMLPGDVLQTGALPVRGLVVAGEGKRATDVETTLLQGGSPRQLADLGVGYILVERSTPGPLGRSATTLTALTVLYEDPHFALYRVPEPTERTSSTTHRAIAITAHLTWAILLVGGLLAATRTRPGNTHGPATVSSSPE